MSDFERLILGVAAFFSLMAFVVAIELVIIGQPPRHCRYLVPVKTKPGIYACSEYPRAMVKP